MNPIPIHTLIVEDEHSWQAILSEILIDYGLQVDIANSLQEATAKMQETPYRLAIVDLSLGGSDHHNQDGLKVLSTIKRLVPGCSSILLTGYASVELAVAVIQEYGAYTCLRKESFRRIEFKEIVHQALATPSTANARYLSQSTETPIEKEDTTTPDTKGQVLVIEDDAGWRDLLKELLEELGFSVHVTTSYGEAQGKLKRERYCLAVADISLASSLEPVHNQDGFRLLSTIHQANIPTIVVSGFADPGLIDEAYQKYSIFASLEKQNFDRNAFLETVSQIMEDDPLSQTLTEREIEVLELVVAGLGNKEIAAKLFISTNTVKRHLKSIFAKLGVNSRAAASAYAIRMGLDVILPDEP
ncbi:MAG: response regulator [Anaerolineales bacterium]|nr:response regulator [Anaerolineales bacterium]